MGTLYILTGSRNPDWLGPDRKNQESQIITNNKKIINKIKSTVVLGLVCNPSTIPPIWRPSSKMLRHTSISSHYSVTTAHCTQDCLSAPPMFRLVIYVIQPSMPFFVVSVKCSCLPVLIAINLPSPTPQLQPPLQSSAPVLHSLPITITMTTISAITIISDVIFI